MEANVLELIVYMKHKAADILDDQNHMEDPIKIGI